MNCRSGPVLGASWTLSPLSRHAPSSLRENDKGTGKSRLLFILGKDTSMWKENGRENTINVFFTHSHLNKILFQNQEWWVEDKIF